MKRLIFVIFLITLVGCQQIKKATRDDTAQKPLSLTIRPGEGSKRQQETEIGIKKAEDKGEAVFAEKAPDEFIFPIRSEAVESAILPGPSKGEKIDMTFNFDNADIKDVLHAILGDILNLNYILDKRVAGQITLHASGKVYKEEVFNIIQTTLNLYDFAIAKQDDIYKVVPLQDVRQLPDKVYEGDKVLKGGYDMTTQIIPLSYIAPQELIPTLRTFLTKGGTAVSPNDTNVVIVIDDASNIERLIAIVKTFDLPFFAGKAVKFYDAHYLDVRSLAKQLEMLAGSMGAITKGRKMEIAFLPFIEANKLIVVTQVPEFFKTVELWIKNMDVAPKAGEEVKLYIYKMQHILAERVKPVLDEVFKEEIEALKTLPPSTSKKEIKIIHDPGTNSFIIKATESDYQRIKGILEALDAIPQQVLIEVIIAEVKLNDNLRYGVQYFIRDRFGRTEEGGIDLNNPERQLGVNLSPPAPGEATFTFMNESVGFDILFSAIAGESSFEFLSTPHILVRDDQTATIQVGSDQPIVSGSTVVGETVTENVQYRSVGIILTVTPHIGENGFVTMDITQEDSEVAGTGVNNNPIFTTRRAQTSLVVKENRTVLIGGIIETRDTLNITKVPLIGDVPVLGNLFRSRAKVKDKTELLVLITPHVINSADEADELTKKFGERLKAVELMRARGS